MANNTGMAVWQGGIKDGKGQISTQSGALNGQPYGYAARFEDKPGTNPEELLGAAHAACFTMALSGNLEKAGVTNVSIRSSAKVSLKKGDDGFSISSSALTTHITGDGDEATIRQAAEDAKQNCPMSRVLNADITLDVTVG